LRKTFRAAGNLQPFIALRSQRVLSDAGHVAALLSGYPLFPSRLIAAPVSWQIDPRRADRFREDVVYWARIPFGAREIALDGFSWVAPWMKRVLSLDLQFAWPIGIGLIGSAAVLLLAWLEARLRRTAYFWMSTAPASVPNNLLDLDGARATLLWLNTPGCCSIRHFESNRRGAIRRLPIDDRQSLPLRSADREPNGEHSMGLGGPG
jgi:hypothetical protein